MVWHSNLSSRLALFILFTSSIVETAIVERENNHHADGNIGHDSHQQGIVKHHDILF